jgi:hypothetical protein
MSPKSRGRKSKKKSSRPRPVNPRASKSDRGSFAPNLGGLPDPTILDYFFAAAESEDIAYRQVLGQLLDESGDLLAVTGPRQLEQATAEMLGAALSTREVSHLRPDMVFRELVEVARDRVRSDIAGSNDTWRGPWWLLHGLASLGSFGDGGYAAQQIAAVKVPAGEPNWLGLLPGVSLTGDVYELRDTWGLEIGIIGEFAYPGGDPHVYLLGLDASWDISITAAGVYDDVAAAETAWRSSLSAGETASEIQPITRNGLAILYGAEHCEELTGLDNLLTEHYRAERRIGDIVTKLGSRRAKPSPGTDAGEFMAWYRARRGSDPDEDLAVSLSEEWDLGLTPGTSDLMSPRRANGFYEYVLNMFVVEPAELDDMVPEWIRWRGEKTGTAPEVIETLIAALP